MTIFSAILESMVRMTAPILLSSIGSLFGDRAGVTNITAEGTMLISAFTAVVTSFFTHNWVIAVAVGVLTGMIVSALFSLITDVLGGNELIIGFAFNVLFDGLTIFLLKKIFMQAGSIVSNEIVPVPRFHFRLIEGIPVLSSILNKTFNGSKQ